MNFQPTDDQKALAGALREVLEKQLPRERLFTIEGGLEDRAWQAVAEFGVFDPELGLANAAIAFEELGRSLLPGPLVATFLSGGQDRVTVLEADRAPLRVLHLHSSNAVMVLGEDLRRFGGGDPARQLEHPLDPLSPTYALESVPGGEVVGDADVAARWRRDGALLTAALQVGIAAKTTELAVAYAKEREQFGHTIGSFQAVKHICADMLVRAEVARAALHNAAVTVDDPEIGDPARAVAGAKLLADDAAVKNARACIQVHGGMGFTWEVVCHLYLKRAWVHATEFGTAEEHAEAVAALL